MKILIAEDDAIGRRMLESLLPMWGHEIVCARDGRAAWDILRDTDAPRLLLIDWVMPGLDGLEVTRLVRKQPDQPYVYILLLTARDSREDMVHGLDAGADDYIAKPFDPNELRARLNAAQRVLDASDQQERLAEQLARKNARLAELTETAHRFVDNVSHEFRTPLAVIKEFAAIVADGLGGPVTNDQREYLQTITNSVHDLTQMVDDLLDSSKLKSGTLRVAREPQTPSDLVDAVLPMVRGRAAAKSLEIRVERKDDLPLVFADREKAGRILVNLLVNAIKFSPEHGAITIDVQAAGDDVRFAVIDRGPGMSHEDLQGIFERFTQFGGECATTAKGFGLGLNIARELAWLNLGTIDVQSQAGVGSTFSFTLPRYDQGVIVDRYLDRLAELPARRGHLGALVVRPRTAATPGEIWSFVCSSCYPTDLVVPVSETDRVLAVGPTDSIESWQERLVALRSRSIVEHPGVTRPELDIECVGRWSVTGHRDHVRSALLQQLAMETSHA